MTGSGQPIILFDGVCNYCNSMVNFIIRQDIKKQFLFSPLQSLPAQELLQKFQLPENDFASFILIDKGKIHLRSTASLHVFKKLPWYWKWTQIFWLVPKFLRDGVYNVIAKNRYNWFGKKETCMIPTAELKHRFLD